MIIRPGTVYLAGSGPGDPGLLTVRAQDLLRGCDCIVYDALVSPEIMSQANPVAEKIYVGKRGKQHAYEQPEINALLLEKARAGKRVLRFKGGDPYLFGRGAEEAIHLVEGGASVEVVPGVTAGIAAPAYAGIPVTHREHASAVAFVTGHEDPTKPESALDWSALAKIGTLCFYMGVKNLARITEELAKHISPETPVAVIEWGTTPRQRTATGTLTTIVDICTQMKIQAPALTVVGEVVRYRQQLNFFERAPLLGKRILVTRARAQSSDLAAGMRELGATVYEFPTIRIVHESNPALTRATQELADARYDWLVLTSVNGVDSIFEELGRQQRDARSLRVKVAAIGSATQRRLQERGIRADLVPLEYIAESVVAALQSREPLNGKRILLARADIARNELPAALKKLDADVTDVIAYKTILETEGQETALSELEKGAIDIITFTSASTARNFSQILGPERLKTVLANAPKCLSIGPITSAAMKEAGIPLTAESPTHDIPALIELIRTRVL
jgi:uroporphyrinogen III methyltransferase / synthase